MILGDMILMATMSINVEHLKNLLKNQKDDCNEIWYTDLGTGTRSWIDIDIYLANVNNNSWLKWILVSDSDLLWPSCFQN